MPETDDTSVLSNLLIRYLRLFLTCGIKQGVEQVRGLVAEILAAPELAQAFIEEYWTRSSDPELTELLGSSKVGDLARAPEAAALKT